MSPGTPATEAAEAVTLAVSGIRHAVGDAVRNERRRRRWTLAELATRSRVAVSTLHGIEAGKGGSLEVVVRVARALALEVRVDIVDPRQRPDRRHGTDVVHAAMGELEVSHLRTHGFGTGIDEPYQHYQFAGRADVIAWDIQRRALLHIENRTRFPDIQAVAGSFNAKRDHLAESIARRVGLRRFESQTHVIAALWSAEVLHSIRLRPATFQALCPDTTDAFDAWWRGDVPRAGATSSLILLDPFASGRQRRTLSLDEALGPSRPRVRGYWEAARRLGGEP